MKTHEHGINPAAKPSGEGCVECQAKHGWWFHLRRCAECGHIGCCDSSPGQHATRHSKETGHTIIASYEPGETWFYSYSTQEEVRGAELAAPRWHPKDQPVPGPADRVPANWQSKLHS